MVEFERDHIRINVVWNCVWCYFKYSEEVLGRTNHLLPLILHKLRTERRIQQFFILACVFVAAVTFSTEPLPSNDRGYTYRHRYWWEGFMKYEIEMSSGDMSYRSGFIKTGSAIQKLILGDVQTAWRSHKPPFIFQNKESRLRIACVPFSFILSIKFPQLVSLHCKIVTGGLHVYSPTNSKHYTPM
jgi:hypothetical protein